MFLLLLALAAEPHIVRKQAQLMGTVVEIQVWTADDAAAGRGAEAAFAELRRLEGLMTDWRDDSTIGQLNHHAGDGTWVPLDPDTARVIDKSLEVARRSHGAFDVTVGVFRGLWKLDNDVDGSIPPPADVAARTRLVGWKDLQFDARKRAARLRRRGQKVTLGGIAKGYAVDRAVDKLRATGLSDFIVQAGGDFFASGKRGERGWRVGVRDPRGPRDDYFAMAEISNEAFSTSGDYERFVIRGGKRYHHILDAHTGMPAQGARGVTVLAKTAFDADAWDTTLFLLGAKKASALLGELPGIEMVLVDDRNQVHQSPGMAKRLKILRPPTDGP